MSPSNEKLSPATKRILVIDDDPSTCLFFKSLLSPDGFQLQTTLSGKEGLEHLKLSSSKIIDLIVLDLMMPGYGGYEVLKELQEPGYQNVPIFIVTARNLDVGTIDMIRSESNVFEFWTKPVDTRKFKSKVHEVLGTQPKSKLF